MNRKPILLKVGDVVTIGPPSGFSYKAIKFPRPNFIIKRGGIVNYKTLIGLKVIVLAVTGDEEIGEVVVKRCDGKRFFNVLPTVKVDINKAVKTGELILKSNISFKP